MPNSHPPRRLVIETHAVRRTLERDGDTLRTTRIENRLRQQSIAVDSDEFAIRLRGGKRVTARDCVVAHVRTTGNPQPQTTEIHYQPRTGLPPHAPTQIVVRFQVVPPAAPNDPGGLRKSLHITFPPDAPDPELVEIERLRTTARATRGGRGEPVVLADHVVLLPENPSQQTRHTDGNSPRPYSHRYERVGNHSVVELEGGDREPSPEPGLLRCLHFPQLEHTPGQPSRIQSQSVLLMAVGRATTPENTVLDHIQPPAHARAFTHYNNWFDPDGKNLRGNTLPSILARFQNALQGSGIRLDALVPDNGWQDRRSVWRPDPGQFPGGNDELATLGKRLAASGSGLGLWMALDNTTNDNDFAAARGFPKAKPNAYFRQYFPHQSLADPAWRTAVARQLHTLATSTELRYVKLDFNHLSHTVPTDRHGHEAELDGFIALTTPLRERGIFVNATNWTWHAPAWRKLADTVWMLAGDDGFNGNFPELSGRAQATTDRDTYFWRLWGDPDDRPWFPISAIMTHGIIRNAAGQMALPTDTSLDWSDHVLMHYGRGTLLREWYLSPDHVTADEWKALIAVHQWADARRADLIQTTYVGGRPDEGYPYAYVGWSIDGQSGTIVARNPSPAPTVLEIPLDARSRFRDTRNRSWTGTLVYPRREPLSVEARRGEMLRIEMAGYETVAVELAPGNARKNHSRKPLAEASDIRIEQRSGAPRIAFDPAVDQRRSLLVIGYPALPVVLLNDRPASPKRVASGTPNTFAGYAVDGMPSARAQHWTMAEFDLASYGNTPITVALQADNTETRAEAWVLAERSVFEGKAPAEGTSPKTFPGFRRQTRLVLHPTRLTPTPVPTTPLSDHDLIGAIHAEIEVAVFGNSPGFAPKTVFVNNQPVGVLPTGDDRWIVARFPLPIAAPTGAPRTLIVQIRTRADDDKFKLGRFRYRITTAGGKVHEVRDALVATHDPAWAYAEGKAMEYDAMSEERRSPAVTLAFPRP